MCREKTEFDATIATIVSRQRKKCPYATSTDRGQIIKLLRFIMTQIDTTVELLSLAEIMESVGCPILSVAPAFSAEEYPSKEDSNKPEITGKNFSYVTKGGKPIPIQHQQYRHRDPTPTEKARWFAHTQNRGVLLRGKVIIIDLDLIRFVSQEDCDRALSVIISAIPDCIVENSIGGGYHIPVICDSLPDFKNFKIEGTGHIGEIIKEGNPGCCVTSPSAGYKIIKTGSIPTISSVADLGILPFKKISIEPAIVPTVQKADLTVEMGEGIPSLVNLMSKNSKTPSGDRSASLVIFAKEASGWVNFCTAHNLGFVGSAESLTEQFAIELEVDLDRLARILNGVDLAQCQPAIYAATKGDEAAVLRHYSQATGKIEKQNQYELAGMNNDRIPAVLTKLGDWRLPDHSAFASYIVAKFGDSIGKWNDDIYVRSSKTGLMTKHYTGLYGSGENLRLMITEQTRLTTIGDMSGEFSNPWLVGCESCLVARVRSFKPCDDKNLLPLKNGVLNISEGILYSYNDLAAKGQYFVWQSYANFNPSEKCPNFTKWVDESIKDSEKALLKAVMFASLTGRFDLKFCVELVGKRDTGKSVLVRVMTALFGGNDSGTVFSVDVKKLLNPDARHATSNIVGKKLVLIPDTKGYVGSSDVFKQITSGGDLLESERKNKDSANFVFEGILWITGNDSIRFADDDDATRSRRLQIRFTVSIPVENQVSLLDFRSSGMVGKFADELDGILNWVLSAQDTAKDIILEAKKEASRSADLAKEDNYLVLWLEECAALIEGEYTQLGEPQTAIKGDMPISLYGSYRAYCERVGAKAKGMNAFKKELLDTCNHYQNKVEVIDKRKNNKSVIVGMVLIRTQNGAVIPSVIEKGTTWNGKPLSDLRDEPETDSKVASESDIDSSDHVALESSFNKSDATYYENIPRDQIQVGDEVTDQISRRSGLKVTEISGDTIKLAELVGGSPFATRTRNDCAHAKRLVITF